MMALPYEEKTSCPKKCSAYAYLSECVSALDWSRRPARGWTPLSVRLKFLQLVIAGVGGLADDLERAGQRQVF